MLQIHSGGEGLTKSSHDMDWLISQPGIPSKENRESGTAWRPPFQRSLALLRKYCIDQVHDDGPNLLEAILISERRDVGLRWSYYWQLAAIGILERGPGGVARLIEILHGPSRTLAMSTVIEVLWRTAAELDLLRSGSDLTQHLPPFNVSKKTVQAARSSLDDIIIAAQNDPDVFSRLMNYASQDAIGGATHGTGFAAHFIRVSGDASISLTQRALDQFAGMISSDLGEEEYQRFLKVNTTLLDPLSAEVLPKYKLGSEFVTDFVIRRHDYRYIAVEIEKPQDRIFTQAGDFTAPFSHAVGQVLDFQRWVGENNAYAKKNLPLIENPHGLLVMGRRTDLSEEQQAKLRWWQFNSKQIEVLTFDDLVERGRLLLRSLRPA